MKHEYWLTIHNAAGKVMFENESNGVACDGFLARRVYTVARHAHRASRHWSQAMGSKWHVTVWSRPRPTKEGA